MPVTSTSLSLSCLIVHDGEMRRSDPEFSEVTRMGMSPAVCMLMIVETQLPNNNNEEARGD